MNMDRDGTCALRERLVLAAMGIAAAGCSSAGEPSVPGPGEASATATAAVTSETPVWPLGKASSVVASAAWRKPRMASATAPPPSTAASSARGTRGPEAGRAEVAFDTAPVDPLLNVNEPGDLDAAERALAAGA